MESAKVNDWIQIIGIFGVLTGLVFSVLKFNKTHEQYKMSLT